MANALMMPMDAAAMPVAKASPLPAGGAAGNALKAMAPAPTPQPSSGPSPYAMPKKPQQNALLGMAVDGFMRGFAPQQWQQNQDQRKADGAEKAKQTLALMQQQRALPEQQRGQWWQQNAPTISEIIGQDVSQMPLDVSKFSDQALDGQIAALSAQLGIAPEKPEFMNLGGGAVGKVQGGKFSMEQEPAKEPLKPIEVDGVLVDPETYEPLYTAPKKVDPADYVETTLADGVYFVNKNDPKDKIKIGAAPPKSESGGAIGGFKTLSPQEAEARGYPKGTVVQVDNRGAEYVRSRPSTAQTGQPTESERAAGLHAQIALNGFRRLTDMEENQGYNRAGVVEQMFGGTFGLEKEKQYDQAADEFIDGYLRAMTGAAATKTEIDTYKKQWFPVWGDTAAVIEQKARGRLNALQGMKSKAGRSWNHEWDGLIADLAKQIGVDPNQFVGGPVMDYQSPAPSGLSADEQAELEALRAEFGAR